MKLSKVILTGGPKQTGEQMKWLVNEYFRDMAPWASCSMLEIFNKIKKIPFVFDPVRKEKDPKTGKIEKVRQELLKRPKFTMEMIGPGGDCDDKAIAMASWAKLNGLPWRFVAVGRKRPDMRTIPLTHVFAEVKILDSWIPCDCTYAFNNLGQLLYAYERREVL